jgi:cytochrome c oxidase assembly protein subunit 15
LADQLLVSIDAGPAESTNGHRPSRAAAGRLGGSRAIAVWLLACCALVFAMVVVGGVTRLTHSGLSITEWQPIVGTIPPLSDSDWNQAFAKYQATPEYRQVNAGMTLAQFKSIFWWEYAHRLLGRTIGAAFLLPYLWFLLRRQIPPGYALPLFGVFVLGGLQGALGWYMVQSGLVDDPRVSQFRLTAHLALAFAIFGAMLWIALSLSFPRRLEVPGRAQQAAKRGAYFLFVLVCIMIVAGGLVAGLRAGFAYNTFPSMNGHFVPPEVLSLTPWWRNPFWNMATVQFDHRIIAWLIAIVVPFVWWRARTAGHAGSRVRISADALLAMAVLQIALGIATLLLVVPLPLAALHQAGALVLFALSINLVHALR